MRRSTRLLRNVVCNWLGFAVNSAVTLLLTPFVLHELGAARYGIWIFTSSVIGYYGLLDLGLRGSVNQYLTRHLAVRDRESAARCLSTALALLGPLGGVCLVLTIVTAHVAPRLWNIPAELAQEAFWCLLIVGATGALQFLFFPFMAIFAATQRFDLANVIGVTTRLLTAVLIYAGLKGGYGLVGISAAVCGATLLDYVVRWRVALRLVPGLELSLRRVSRAHAREMAAFSAWTFLIAVNSYVYLYVQPLLVGALLPIAAVGHLALATGLSRQIDAALRPIGHVMYPAAAALHAQGDRDGLERLYHAGTRLMLLAAVFPALAAWFWSDDFYRLWIGSTFADGGVFPPVGLLLRVLLVVTITTSVSCTGGHILVGAGRARLMATLLICGSAINLSLSLTLIPLVGLVGATVATVAASVVVDLVVVPVTLQRALGLRVTAFVRQACVRPLVAAAIIAVLIACIRGTGVVAGWWQLIVQGAMAGVAALVVLLAVGITAEERSTHVVEPLRQLLPWVRLKGSARAARGTLPDIAPQAWGGNP